VAQDDQSGASRGQGPHRRRAAVEAGAADLACCEQGDLRAQFAGLQGGRVEHCLKASTSPHLAEQLTGNRDFLLGTLDDVMFGRVSVPADRPVVFSPFGLGVLDLAVGKYVYDEVARSGELNVIDEFFHELRRYG
jgi:hypothetical protein